MFFASTFSKVPEGHNPRGTRLSLSEGFLEASTSVSNEGSAGLCGALGGSTGFSEGNDPMLVTLGSCWTFDEKEGVLWTVEFEMGL